jgi:hypothetical protein
MSKAKKRAARKVAPKAADGEIEAKRAKAYAEIEPHLCNVVRMGEIASMLFDSPDQGQFVFAVTHLEDSRISGNATTPWTSCHEARPVIDHVRTHPESCAGRPFRQRRLSGTDPGSGSRG